jgi:hypothetical protein
LEKLTEKEKAIKDRREKEEKIKIMKIEEAKRAEEERIRRGEKGKGEKDNYKKLCKKCFIEFQLEDLEKCTNCNSTLITKEVIYYINNNIKLGKT